MLALHVRKCPHPSHQSNPSSPAPQLVEWTWRARGERGVRRALGRTAVLQLALPIHSSSQTPGRNLKSSSHPKRDQPSTGLHPRHKQARTEQRRQLTKIRPLHARAWWGTVAAGMMAAAPAEGPVPSPLAAVVGRCTCELPKGNKSAFSVSTSYQQCESNIEAKRAPDQDPVEDRHLGTHINEPRSFGLQRRVLQSKREKKTKNEACACNPVP